MKLTERDRVEGRWWGSALGIGLAGGTLLGLFGHPHGGLPWTLWAFVGGLLGWEVGLVTLPVARRLHPLPKCPTCARLLP